MARRAKARDGAAVPAGLAFRPVTAADCDGFVRLFQTPGAPGFCWCMVWRRTAAEAKEKGGAAKRRQMLARIGGGAPVGLVGHDGETPVAWVSVAPRETYRNLGGPPALPGEAIWSIACFFALRRIRGAGLTRTLIEAAAAYARESGATAVEAYPVDDDAPSYRFMGRKRFFAAAGFRDLGRAGTRRTVMRLDLTR